MTKHTPGPWKVLPYDPETDQEISVVANHEILKSGLVKADWICEIVCHDLESITNEMHETAHLIAAAPDLLEACKAIFNNKKCLLEVDEIELLCKAIGKAEGE